MKELTPHGRAALEKVARWLEDGAPHVSLEGGLKLDRFNMSRTVRTTECGTSCCIAGAVCQFEGLGLSLFSREMGREMPWHGEGGAAQLVVEYLGLDLEDDETLWGKLFCPWEHFDGPDWSFNAPARGAAVIRHFLATGEVDWDLFNEDGSPYSDDLGDEE